MLLGSPLPLRLPLLLAVVMVMVVVVFPAALAARPPPRDRLFVSVVVDAAIASVSAHIADPQLRAMFEQTLPNTLDTTVYYDAANNDTVLITGDIAAMWLRDASNQVRPYLRYASQDPKLAAMLRGLLRRMSECVLTDPYANAFNQRPDAQAGGNQADMTTRPSFLGTRVGAMTRQVFERKFEIDSLLAFIKLANGYWAATADDAPFRDPQFLNAVQAALQVLAQQQLSPLDARDANPPYTFLRTTTVPTDTLVKGVGALYRATGMLATPFRPSDDATTLPFLVPANCMAVVELAALATLLRKVGQPELAQQSANMSATIDAAVRRYGVVTRNGTAVLAYEVDGFGNALFMDDANVPSLLSLPYLGWVARDDPLYLATRRAVLSNATNPFFFQGAQYAGVGSPHTDTWSIWPMALAVQALTATEDAEITRCLQQLVAGSAGTLFMHESFDVAAPATFSRPWFAWANSLFGELVLELYAQRPHLLAKPLF